MRSLFAVYDVEELITLDVPWWTFDAARRVDAFLGARPEARVLEWGSGASTIWLARRAGTVTSIEHDRTWAEVVGRLLPSNARLLRVPPVPVGTTATPILSQKSGYAGLDFTDYVAAIDEVDGPFDVIVIDGRARAACLERAISCLAPGGLAVVDNVERRRYRSAIASLGPQVAVTWTRGLTPCLLYPTGTALVTLLDPRMPG